MFTPRNLMPADPLHWSPINGDRGVLTGPPPEIHHQLLGLTDVQRDVVVVTPVSQGVHLFSVGWFTLVGDQTYHRCVICKFDDDVGATQSCVYREYRRGLRTQPWGASVLRVSGEEMFLPTLTTCRLPVRKSRIQLHRELFRYRARSFTTSLKGTMALNAEL